MSWYFYVAYFFGGAFLTNAIPHLVNGISGRSFPTLLSSPPGKGLSSPTVNVLYGALNLAIGYLLVCHVGEFHIRSMPDVLVLGAGGLVLAIALSRALGNFIPRSVSRRLKTAIARLRPATPYNRKTIERGTALQRRSTP